MTDKQALYHTLVQQAGSIIHGEKDLIANMANLSALLFNQLANVNWAGFYLYKEGELVLGPFQGQVACIRIAMGKGVCGTAALSRTTQRVDDVHDFAGHIACDAASNSEIVIPIVINDELIGVLDIDSPIFSRFDEDDQKGLEQLVACFVEHYHVMQLSSVS
ncbi:GAF domain-containing protein [Glaciecola sp. XM2]|uniref:GAF domain-containing protein n=1 Tax=Glaciecola sp. XM2 TaxID=1914931 RepID=UPI001BDDD2A8|nr:GAF domain-containing protein [Glaciecola sp. XM2]MBT1449701.1 GAF domain-containing protein [Glaciecola sp. XM2]